MIVFRVVVQHHSGDDLLDGTHGYRYPIVAMRSRKTMRCLLVEAWHRRQRDDPAIVQDHARRHRQALDLHVTERGFLKAGLHAAEEGVRLYRHRCRTPAGGPFLVTAEQRSLADENVGLGALGVEKSTVELDLARLVALLLDRDGGHSVERCVVRQGHVRADIDPQRLIIGFVAGHRPDHVVRAGELDDGMADLALVGADALSQRHLRVEQGENRRQASDGAQVVQSPVHESPFS